MSFNPLTSRFRARVEAVVGCKAGYYDAADLRKKSVAAGLKDLRRIRADKLVIAIENEAGRALIGPLSLAAAFTRTRSIEVIWPDLHTEVLGRFQALSSIVFLLRDTFRARRALARSKATIAQFERTPMPRSVPAASGNRVLYLDANISLGAPIGGAVGHTAGVVDGFLQRGFSVDYASLKPVPVKCSGAAWLQLHPGTLLAVPSELNYYSHAELIEHRLSRAHHAHPWSFIYQRFSLHNFSGPLLAHRLNIPCVLEFNGSEVWAAEHWGVRLALHEQAMETERAALKRADLLVTVSDVLARDLRSKGIPEERILVYPNCVDPEMFDAGRFSPAEVTALRSRHGIPHDAFVVEFIGTFGQWHGVDFFAECIRMLLAEEPEWADDHKIHFLLVGDGLKMPIVRDILNEDRVRRRVTLAGLVAQSDAPKYLACADLLVAPHIPNADSSEFFGSPTKLFEYMAMRRPILASALGQIADVMAGRGATKLGPLPPGVEAPCGLLFEPASAQGFITGMRALVESPALRAELAAAARAEVLARYTWNRHVSAILQRMIDLKLLDARQFNV